MTVKQLPVDFPEVQAAIYRVALSLDSFLLNGIPIGVFQFDFFNGFLQKTAGNLLRELASLEEHASDSPVVSQAKVKVVLAELRAKCQELIDRVTDLIPFRTLSLEQLHSAVARIPVLREAFVQLIQELEGCFQTPTPFYQSRPSESIASVNTFLADLGHIFAQEWAASNKAAEERGQQLSVPSAG